jgi:ribosomal protein S18 acetylase RimI-like enzyme
MNQQSKTMQTRSIRIRTARSDDYRSVAALIFSSHTISFAPFASSNWVDSRDLPEYQSKWQEILAEESLSTRVFVAESNGEIVGSVRVSSAGSNEFDAQLNGMHVSPDATGSGIGSLLMKQAITFIKEREFKNVELGVIAANSRARRFYETHGWELVEELPDGIEGVPIAVYRLRQ